MKILIVGILGKNPHFKRVTEEAQKRGHQADGCFASDLCVHANPDEFEIKLKNNLQIDDYKVIYLWTLGKRRWEWQVALNYLINKDTVKVVNRVFAESSDIYMSPSVLVQFMAQYRIGLPFPETTLFYNTKTLSEFIGKYSFPLILKYANSRKGENIYKIQTKEELFEKVQKMQMEKEPLLVREFIPNNGDIRVFTVGYKAIGAMKRTPPEGDFRSNISVGGEGSVFDLTSNPQVQNIAEYASKVTKTEIAGVDIMLHKETGKPYILEVNPGPQFTGLEKYTGVNAAGKIIEYFESLV